MYSDNFATVDEAVKALEKNPTLLLPTMFLVKHGSQPLHLSISDKNR